MAVVPPKRMRRGPRELEAATAVRLWAQRGPGASSSASQLQSTGRKVGAGISREGPMAMTQRERERDGGGGSRVRV